ncbi:MAG: sugar phosphate isomerase/epimerase family protein [Tunicatimonas sp.]
MTKHYLLLAAFLTIGLSASAQNKPAAPQIGVVQEMDQASVLEPMGYKYLLESTRRILSPRNVTDQQFEALLPTIKAMPVPMYGCNLFIPGDLKVVGPEVDEQAVLAYVEPVLQRAQEAGLTLITWGSGGSRSVPEGFSRLTATAQFIYMAKRVAEVAAKYDMILALENLNSTECNFITTLGEALAVVKAVDHPNLRLCVDVYHMLKENEPASAIAGSKGYAVYCEVAEREARTPPGVQGDDFTPYITALKKEGYTGKIVIEARWDDLAKQGPMAYRTLREQIDSVYKK